MRGPSCKHGSDELHQTCPHCAYERGLDAGRKLGREEATADVVAHLRAKLPSMSPLEHLLVGTIEDCIDRGDHIGAAAPPRLTAEARGDEVRG
jgi:hypothetical protein